MIKKANGIIIITVAIRIGCMITGSMALPVARYRGKG
jgi:hypothetical protein